jgi:Flp pilus assembly protein TadG
MVEFAFCFPMLLILVISIVDFGHYLETVNNLDTVVRDGTRYASIDTAATSFSCTSGNLNCSSDTIQGVLQAEADSLTVSAGGVTLANTNCTWSSSTTPPSLSSSPTAPDQPTSSCITIAYYPSSSLTTQPCAYYQTSNSRFTNVDGGTCTAANATVVQITVAVVRADSGNPITLCLNNLKLMIYSTYSMPVV